MKRPYDTIEAPVRIETRLAEPADVLWVAVKSHQLVATLRAVPPGVGITTIVLLRTCQLTLLAFQSRTRRAGDDLGLGAFVFGTALLSDWSTLAIQMLYVVIYAALLALREYNDYSLDALIADRGSAPTV